MSHEEVIHQLYKQCLELNFDETYMLLKKAESREEKAFIRLITDFVLQQRQRKVIQEKRF